MKNRKAAVAILIAIISGTATAARADSYNFITINVPGLTNTVATDINNRGQIVGYGTGSGGQTGFLDQAGIFTGISFAGASTTTVNGLNDAGRLVGTYSNSTGSHGFEYSGGSYTTVDAGSNAVAGTTSLEGINNSGQIAGNATIPDVISGTAPDGFVMTAGSSQFVPWGPGGFLSVSGINNSAHITGSAGGILLPNAAIYGTADAVSLYAFQFASFEALNDRGQIVADGDYVISNLNSSDLGPAIVYPGAVSTNILGINDAGWLVGDYVDSSGVQHAFEATTATPEPGTIGLLTGALLLMSLFAAKRKFTGERST